MSTSSPPAANSMRQQLDELDALLQRMLELPINQAEDAPPAPPPPPQRRAVEARPAPPPPVAPPPPPVAAPRRPQQMVLLTDSGPVPQPKGPPEHWDQGWAINLNPQQGSSVLGPRSPAAGVVQPQASAVATAPPPPVWRAETVTYVQPHKPPTAPPRPQPVPVVVTNPAVTVVAAPPAPVHAAPAPAAPPRPAPRAATAPPAPLVLRPLVGLNRAFDAVVIRFGPPGRFLRSPLGRSALGVSGFLMLAGGVAWGVLDWVGWTW